MFIIWICLESLLSDVHNMNLNLNLFRILIYSEPESVINGKFLIILTVLPGVDTANNRRRWLSGRRDWKLIVETLTGGSRIFSIQQLPAWDGLSTRSVQNKSIKIQSYLTDVGLAFTYINNTFANFISGAFKVGAVFIGCGTASQGN